MSRLLKSTSQDGAGFKSQPDTLAVLMFQRCFCMRHNHTDRALTFAMATMATAAAFTEQFSKSGKLSLRPFYTLFFFKCKSFVTLSHPSSLWCRDKPSQHFVFVLLNGIMGCPRVSLICVKGESEEKEPEELNRVKLQQRGE